MKPFKSYRIRGFTLRRYFSHLCGWYWLASRPGETPQTFQSIREARKLL